MIQKATFRSTDKRQSVISTNSSINRYDAIEKSFLEAVADLMEELRIQEWNDIGILSDIVLKTDTVSKAAVFSKHNSHFRNSTGSNWSNKMLSLKKSSTLVEVYKSDDETDAYPNSKRDPYKPRKRQVDDEEEVIESNATIFSGSGNPNRLSEGQMSSSDETRIEDLKSISDRLSVEDSNGEDKHIFLAKRITDEQVVSRLMSQGYRFSEPVFISKTMANKLRIHTEQMRQSFKNMQQMADSICALTQNNWHPFIEGPAPKPTRFTACINPTVCVGVFVLIGGDSELQDMNIVVEKCKEFSFPNVQLVNEAGQPQPQLDRTEIEFICNLQGRSLFEIAQLENILDANNELYIPTRQFVQIFQHAAQELINRTPYNKALFQYSKLHTTIMDLPPFSITAGPCQMIVFKSYVNTPEILTAINHTPSDPFKCIPLSIYKSFSAFITDQAASIYQMSHSNHSHPTYLIQQQMYRQAGIQSPDKKDLNDVYELEKLSTADNNSSVSSDPFSLRPPPRAKRNRFKLTNAILNNSPFDIIPNTSTNEGDESNGITGSRLLPPPPLTVLSTGDRFWWINPLAEETLHSNM
jgi:hypothetical protein